MLEAEPILALLRQSQVIRRRRRQPQRRRRRRRWGLRQVVKPAAAAGQRGSCAVDSIASLRKLTALPRGR